MTPSLEDMKNALNAFFKTEAEYNQAWLENCHPWDGLFETYLRLWLKYICG